MGTKIQERLESVVAILSIAIEPVVQIMQSAKKGVYDFLKIPYRTESYGLGRRIVRNKERDYKH